MASDVKQSIEQHNRHKALDPPLTIGDKYFLTAMVSDQNIEAGRDNKHSPSCLHPILGQGCQMRLLTSSNVLTIGRLGHKTSAALCPLYY